MTNRQTRKKRKDEQDENLNLSGFINTIFEYYCPVAEASIAQTLNHLNGELSKYVSDISGDEKTKNLVVETLLLKKKTALFERLSHMRVERLLSFGLIREILNIYPNQTPNAAKISTTQDEESTSKLFWKNMHDCPTSNEKKYISARL